MSKKKVLLVCERSAGHIFPALVLAKKMRQEQYDVYFFVTASFLRCYLQKEGFPVLGKAFSFRNLLMEITWRFFEAIYIILKIKPRYVFGFGGRDSFFLMLLGCFLFLDTAIYEPNVRFGKANKLLKLFVKKVLCGFNDNVKKGKYRHIGVPLRENIRKIPKKDARAILGLDDKPVIFCFGGSQGSAFINQVASRLFTSPGNDYQMIHLTGKREYPEIFDLYNKINKNKIIKDFDYSVEILYSAADIVICRAGALTLGEITYYGLPAVLIPHPGGGNHQKENAYYFKNRQAALVFEESDFSFEELDSVIKKILYNEGFRQNIITNVEKIKLGVGFEEFCKKNIY